MSTKEKVINALERSKGEFLSGAALAAELGVSRNSIWKVINELKKKGYDIEAVTNKGYRLTDASDIISKQGIGIYLNEPKIMDLITICDEVSSTNDEALKHMISDSEEKRFQVILAKKQSKGRGQNGAEFESPDGGIYMSIIMPSDHLRVLDVSIASAALTAYSIEKITGVKVQLGWRTSLYMNEKKIGGILTEVLSAEETGMVKRYILGIGIRCDLLEYKKGNFFFSDRIKISSSVLFLKSVIFDKSLFFII